MVQPGAKLNIEKLDAVEGGVISFDQVLLAFDEKNCEVGKPTVKNVKVEARVLKQARARKIIVFKYHSKTRYRKKNGHRQPYTQVEITKVAA